MFQQDFQHCRLGSCFFVGTFLCFTTLLILMGAVKSVTPIHAQEVVDTSAKHLDEDTKDMLEDSWLHHLESSMTLSSRGTELPLCRFGVNAPTGVLGYPVDELRVSWYQNYGTRRSPDRPNGVEFVQTIRLSQTSFDTYRTIPSMAVISQTAVLNPGAIWFVGNEPDRKFFQDDIEPHLYARAYHDLYTVIKGVDPTARIFAGSIVQPTPLRLIYLDKVLAAYKANYRQAMPVDGWSIHNFILNEVSCEVFPLAECWGADIPPGVDAIEGLRVDAQDNDNLDLFIEQLERFRGWMWLNGYRNTPLYLSEFGVLMPEGVGFNPDFTPERVSQFMKQTFDYLLSATHNEHGYPPDGNRLVQRFSWFSTDYKGFNGSLFDPDSRAFTEIGLTYKEYASTLHETVDFLPVRLTNAVVPLLHQEQVSLRLTAQIANSGNGFSSQSIRVRFYDGDPETDGVQIGETQTVQSAGCGETVYASVIWPNMSAGTYTVYVVVSGLPDGIAENGVALDNNVLRQNILVVSDPLFLPELHK